MFKKYFNVSLIGLVIAIVVLVISTRGIAQHIGLTALGKGFSDNTSDDFLTRLRFSLQLGTFSPPTPAPETCVAMGLMNQCICPIEGIASCWVLDPKEQEAHPDETFCYLGEPYCGVNCSRVNSIITDEDLSRCNKRYEEHKCVAYCVAKPVIYLYPESKTLVDVRLDTPGEVYISDPEYPKDGWKGVEAYPDGHLIYKNKEYPYLYYELAVTKPKISPRGIVIKKEELATKLLEITGKLGLVRHEQEDFLEYWLPRLEKINKSYIVFSLLDKEEKEKVDPVAVSPAPTTRIEFLVNYQPVDYPVTVKPLIFNEVPQRTGFTMVEWGGGIGDY